MAACLPCCRWTAKLPPACLYSPGLPLCCRPVSALPACLFFYCHLCCFFSISPSSLSVLSLSSLYISLCMIGLFFTFKIIFAFSTFKWAFEEFDPLCCWISLCHNFCPRVSLSKNNFNYEVTSSSQLCPSHILFCLSSHSQTLQCYINFQVGGRVSQRKGTVV